MALIFSEIPTRIPENTRTTTYPWLNFCMRSPRSLSRSSRHTDDEGSLRVRSFRKDVIEGSVVRVEGPSPSPTQARAFEPNLGPTRSRAQVGLTVGLRYLAGPRPGLGPGSLFTANSSNKIEPSPGLSPSPTLPLGSDSGYSQAQALPDPDNTTGGEVSRCTRTNCTIVPGPSCTQSDELVVAVGRNVIEPHSSNQLHRASLTRADSDVSILANETPKVNETRKPFKNAHGNGIMHRRGIDVH
ncbi:hypothetical protein FB451DRAFT_1164246 [Mycena latifolia]|nr:hypothetical protein FB451DRAFT_1164246 [Mycena latifolia]